MNPWFWVGVSTVATVILVLGLLRANKINIVAQLGGDHSEWFKKILKWLGENKATKPALALYGSLIFAFVLRMIFPDVYERWIGASWGHFFAFVVAVPVGVAVMSAGGISRWLGGLIIAIGFVIPLLLGTRPVSALAEKYEKVWADSGDRDTENRIERVLPADGKPKSVKLDSRAWRIGIMGEEPGCYALEATAGFLDLGRPERFKWCSPGIKPHKGAVWPFQGEEPIQTGSVAISTFNNSLRIASMGDANGPRVIRFYAKIE